MLQPTALGVAAQQAQASVFKPQNFAEVIKGKDPLTAVNTFCQRFAAKPMSPGDITYTATAIPGSGHQATVHIECLGGVEFAGEVCPTVKEAKVSAAQQVLEMYATEIESMPAEGVKKSKNKKRSAGEAGLDAAAGPRGDGILNASNKGDLNTLYMKIIRRPSTKGEIQYTSGPVVGGFQSQVSLPGLPAPWNQEIWAGEVMVKKTDAEQSVAGVALNTIRSDPSLMAAHNAPPKPNQWLLNGGMKGKSKGKGKGKGHHQSDSVQQQQSFGMGAADASSWNQQVLIAMAAQQQQQQGLAGLGGFSGFSPLA
jgi:hypothetical protein